jgi:heme/copper-type cytochrome/quinol oxidase subunit 2
VPVEKQASLREDVLKREKERFGGVKVGSAFFGWLTATGTAVLLTALVAAAGAAVGLGASGSVDEAANAASQNAETVGLWGAISLIVIMLIAYYCGGYVAGRMARFDGAKQGVAVWLWAVVIAIVVAIVVAIAGSQFNILANLNGFPRIPIDEGNLTAGSIITAILVALAGLIGAILGGVAGMRYHRKVDRAGLGR